MKQLSLTCTVNITGCPVVLHYHARFFISPQYNTFAFKQEVADEIPLYFVNTPKLTAKDNLYIDDRSADIPANLNYANSFTTTLKTFNVQNKRVLITNQFKNGNALYYFHQLPPDVSGVYIEDSNGTPVNVQDYKVHGDKLYNNLSFTNNIRYFVGYIKQDGTKEKKLLNNWPVFVPQVLYALGFGDQFFVIGDTLSNGEVEIRTSTPAGTRLEVKYSDRTEIFLDKVIGGSDSDSWKVRVMDGVFEHNGEVYSIPEYTKQDSFFPIAPFVYRTHVKVDILSDTMIKLPESFVIDLSQALIVTLYVYNNKNQLKYIITQDSSTITTDAAVYEKTFWSYSEYEGIIDIKSSTDETDIYFSLDDNIYAYYYTIEDGFIVSDLEFNPILNKAIRDIEFVGFVILSDDFRARFSPTIEASVQYLFVNSFNKIMDFSLGLAQHSGKDWQSGQNYLKDLLIRYNNEVYICNVDHLSDVSNAPGVSSEWTVVNSFNQFVDNYCIQPSYAEVKNENLGSGGVAGLQIISLSNVPAKEKPVFFSNTDIFYKEVAYNPNRILGQGEYSIDYSTGNIYTYTTADNVDLGSVSYSYKTSQSLSHFYVGSVYVNANVDYKNLDFIDARSIGGSIKDDVARSIVDSGYCIFDKTGFAGDILPGKSGILIEVPSRVFKPHGGPFDVRELNHLIKKHTALGVLSYGKIYDIDLNLTDASFVKVNDNMYAIYLSWVQPVSADYTISFIIDNNSYTKNIQGPSDGCTILVSSQGIYDDINMTLFVDGYKDYSGAINSLSLKLDNKVSYSYEYYYDHPSYPGLFVERTIIGSKSSFNVLDVKQGDKGYRVNGSAYYVVEAQNDGLSDDGGPALSYPSVITSDAKIHFRDWSPL